MKYFVIVCCIIFLGCGHVSGCVQDHHRRELPRRSGHRSRPVIRQPAAGVYYNQCVVLLTDKTLYATTIIPVAGAVLSIVANIILIPIAGYEGAAWSRLLCYASMVILSHMIGQKYYHVPYNVRKILAYFAISIVLCLAGLWLHDGLGEEVLPLHCALVSLFCLPALPGGWTGGRCCGGPDQITCLP